MAVDEHGLEVLKKSGEEVTPGNKSNMYLKAGVISSVLPSGAATEATLGEVRDLLANDFLSGQIEAPTAKTYTLDLYSIDQKTIQTFTVRTLSGTCTAAIQIDGASVTSMSAVSVSSVETTATASGLNTVAVGQTITLVISSVATPIDLVFTLKFVRT